MFKLKTAALLCCCLLLASAPAFALGADAPAEPPKPQKRVEVAFALDTTGSMAGLIDGAKKKIWSIANSIIDQNPDAEIRMGLLAYRDIGDDYVTLSFPLTTDIQGIYAELLQFQANGGGDYPESVNEALDVTVTKLGWTDAQTTPADRIIFLVGDAPPHMDYQQDRKYPEVVAEAAQKGITVNTVQAGSHAATTKIWKEIAALGKGDYLAIPQDGGRVVIIETPYDVIIHDIQIRLNSTVVPYGSVKQQAEVSGKQAMNTERSAASADMAKFVNKSGKGGTVVTGRGDLVADVKSGSAKLADIPEKELPDNMRKMSGTEREKYIKAQSAEREKLAAELAENALKRDEFIKKAEAEAAKTSSAAPGDSFDRSVAKTLEKQIKK